MSQFERRVFAPQSRSQRPEKSLSGPGLTARRARAKRAGGIRVAARAAGLSPSSNFSRVSTGVRQGLLCEYPPLKLTTIGVRAPRPLIRDDRPPS